MAFPIQAYVQVLSGAVANAPVQMYVAVVDASGNLVSSTYAPPGGRLTLTTVVPVLTSTVSAATAVLYTPYLNDVCPIFDGTTMIPTKFTELTNTLNDATTNPAAVVANANYDLYVWNNAGTMTLSRGPLWSKTATVTTPVASPGVVNWTGHALLAGTPVSFSGGVLPTGIVAGTTYYVIAAGLTANAFEISATVGGVAINFTGTSSGTQTGVAGNDTARTNATDLVRQNGILLNNLAITNGPAASRGTYVGTIRTNATSTTDFNVGSNASTGGMATIGVWNCYNRVPVPCTVGNSDAAWTYSSATIREAAGSANMRINVIRGLNEDADHYAYTCVAQSAASAGNFTIGLVADSTLSTGFASKMQNSSTTVLGIQTLTAPRVIYPGLGFHFISANEQGDGTTTFTLGGNGLNHLDGLVRA